MSHLQSEQVGSSKVSTKGVLCRAERSYPIGNGIQAVSFRDAWFEGDGAQGYGVAPCRWICCTSEESSAMCAAWAAMTTMDGSSNLQPANLQEANSTTMLREEDIQRLRKLEPGERARMGIEATRLAWRFLLTLTTEERQRRLDRAREPWNPPQGSEERAR